MDLIFGPLFYRLLITGDVVDEEFINNKEGEFSK
jgi:hypothetical protein